MANESGTGFADDECVQAKANIQVHYYVPSDYDYIADKAAIRNLLLNAGTTYPEFHSFTEVETGLKHLVFECEF